MIAVNLQMVGLGHILKLFILSNLQPSHLFLIFNVFLSAVMDIMQIFVFVFRYSCSTKLNKATSQLNFFNHVKLAPLENDTSHVS